MVMLEEATSHYQIVWVKGVLMVQLEEATPHYQIVKVMNVIMVVLEKASSRTIRKSG